jgi:hypothetical protein
MSTFTAQHKKKIRDTMLLEKPAYAQASYPCLDQPLSAGKNTMIKVES